MLRSVFGPGDIFDWQDPITLRWILKQKTINFIGETKITFPRICAGLGGIK